MLLSCVFRAQKTVADSAVSLVTTDFTPNRKTDTYNVYYADIQVTAGDIRVTADGSTDPTTSKGVIWYVGQTKRVWGITNLTNLKFIRDGADSAVLEVEYWGGPPR